MIGCVVARAPEGIQEFWRLPHFNEFLLDILLVTTSAGLRDTTCYSMLKLVNDGRMAGQMFRVLQQPLPLWPNSGLMRSVNQKLLAHCGEYFRLCAALLSSMSPEELDALNPSVSEMLQNECTWLLRYRY